MMAALATTAMTVGELLGAVPSDLGGIRITDLVSDSRQVQPGAAFVALRGERSHGLDHVGEAISNGAVVVLFEQELDTGTEKEAQAGGQRTAPGVVPDIEDGAVPSLAVPDLRTRLGELAQRFYRLGERGPRLAGITGTNGKSTVAYLVAQAQTLRGYPCAYMGTIGAGVPPTLTAQALTTPDCLSLHRTLASFEADFAAMEVSSHALAQDRVAGLTFDTAVFTNLTRDHLDYHADAAEYQAAKARLFTLEGLRHAVIFVDDPVGETLAQGLAESIERIDVSLTSDGGIRATLTASGLQGVTIEISGALVEGRARGDGVITSPLIGDFNAENLILALGVLLSWNAPVDEACEVLSRCQPPPGRMEMLGGGAQQPTVVVDYAHTPAGLERVLSNLRNLSGADLWCVFGCGGERDAGKRPLMGAAAARFADHIVLTDDNPRGEDPGEIVAAIRAALIDHPDVWIEHDRARAIREAVLKASAGDVVLVAGKGHEAWQWVAGERHPFSDRAVVEAALGGQA